MSKDIKVRKPRDESTNSYPEVRKSGTFNPYYVILALDDDME